jgi:hypothetical protein
MKQSTRRLDEILQQLCAAERPKTKDARQASHALYKSIPGSETALPKTEHDGDDSGIDEVFVDAYEQQQQGLRSNNGDIPVGMGMTEPSLESVDAYFQVQWTKSVRTLLQLAL